MIFSRAKQGKAPETRFSESLNLSASSGENRFGKKVQEKKLWRFENFHFSKKKIFFSFFPQNQYSRFFRLLLGHYEVKFGQLRPLKVASSHGDDVISKLLRHQ